MRKKGKTIVSVIAVLAVFGVAFALISRLLQPKYMTDLEEGSFIAEYYDEAGGHDVIFLGDCEVYANFSPMELYRNHGITSYIRGTPQQLVWMSYYVAEETFRYETPKAIVFNVNAMRYSEPVSEAYNRLTIDKMRWSGSKAGIISASMTEEEQFLSYVFPILRYHSRFDELTKEDFAYLFQSRDNTFNGHQLHTEILPEGSFPVKKPLPDYRFGDICYEYLDKIRLLCEEHGTELILVKAPSLYPYWYDEYDEQIKEYAAEYGLSFYNFVERSEEIGLDFSQDTYDGGYHLNLYGAVKLTRYFGDILAEEHGLEDRREEPEVAAVYDKKLQVYDETIEERMRVQENEKNE
ncbi:MAG: SGNH/GDSL hydrolase family protein [Roseburia sp.]|nr:SGNH/GDSL hydrolase family protein [Roseburia sp.]MCM1097162.1 SGNH/GDSL hydrolase family protein [Ruminococcus flavefaciens]